MGYPNTCPDCNGPFNPGHSCPPRPIGQRVRDLEAENARLQAQVKEAERQSAEALAGEHDDVLALKRMQNALTLTAAERDGLASKLLDVQQDSIRHKARWERCKDALEPFVHSARTIDMPDDVGDDYVVALIPVKLGDVRCARATIGEKE